MFVISARSFSFLLLALDTPLDFLFCYTFRKRLSWIDYLFVIGKQYALGKKVVVAWPLLYSLSLA